MYLVSGDNTEVDHFDVEVQTITQKTPDLLNKVTKIYQKGYL